MPIADIAAELGYANPKRFTENFKALIYGADTAGLCSLIGSLASVINYRIYVREYPENGMKFIKVFTLISWIFFLIVVIPGFLLAQYHSG
jgi:Na+/H+ antiporter NhaD/arsenite permease-like protein